MCVCPLAAKDALLCRLLKRDSCLIRQASRSTGLRTVAIWSSPNALESVAFMCMCVCRCDCVFLCQREIEIERNSGGKRKGERGGWLWWLEATAQLSVPICSHLLSASLSLSLSLFPAVCFLLGLSLVRSLSLSLRCFHSRSDPRLARGNARLDDFTTSTSTAVVLD